MEQMEQIFPRVWNHEIYKCVLSNPRPQCAYKKLVLTCREGQYQLERFTETQVFHETLSFDQATLLLQQELTQQFAQYHGWDGSWEYLLKVAKSGKLLHSKKKCPNPPPRPDIQHNRAKNYLLKQDSIIPPLVDMGIFTKEGKIVQSMYDKFRQINRFLEMIDDEVKLLPPGSKLTALDFGCGKSYLTFVLYYYLREIRQLEVQMIGLDLKADVIEKCNQAAKKYGYDGLQFQVGDVSQFHFTEPLDLVITLHACDTATDYALYHAINWQAKMIFSVPCCQHELNSQIESDSFSLFTRYGIVKERVAALMTDAIRGNLLRCCGYQTHLMEFIELEHTPKNIMIKAVKGNLPPAPKIKQEVEAMVKEFHLDPTLYRLLKESGRI